MRGTAQLTVSARQIVRDMAHATAETAPAILVGLIWTVPLNSASQTYQKIALVMELARVVTALVIPVGLAKTAASLHVLDFAAIMACVKMDLAPALLDILEQIVLKDHTTGSAQDHAATIEHVLYVHYPLSRQR